MTRETKNQNDFINRIIENFKKEYHQARGDEYVVVARGKDRKAASVLAEMHKKKFPDAKTNETLEGLRLYFEMALQVKDTWLLNNMSLSTLAYKYNEIRETLKNPKTNGQQKRSLAEKMDSANAIIDRMYGNTPS